MNKLRPQLTVAFSTLYNRSANIEIPSHTTAAAIDWLTCIQGGDPAKLQADTSLMAKSRIVQVPGIGVARSRNAAIDNALGRYLLFCDDEVLVNLNGVHRAVTLLERSGAALAIGRAVDENGAFRKKYPSSIKKLNLWNSGKVATYEMLVDLDQVRRAGIRFDVNFGAGVSDYLGDEYIFVSDLLRSGLSGLSVPWVFGKHPAISSGSQWGTADDMRARAAAIERALGRRAIAGRTGLALKHWKDFPSRWEALVFSLRGTRAYSPPNSPICSNLPQ